MQLKRNIPFVSLFFMMLLVGGCDIQEPPSQSLFLPIGEGIFSDPVGDVAIPNIDLLSLEFDLSDEVVITLELDSIGGYVIDSEGSSLSTLSLFSTIHFFGIRFDTKADDKIDIFLDFTMGPDVPVDGGLTKTLLNDNLNGDPLYIYTTVYTIEEENLVTPVDAGTVRTVLEGNRLSLHYSDFDEISETDGFYVISAFNSGRETVLDLISDEINFPLFEFYPGLYGG
jgi:hypothetical protein